MNSFQNVFEIEAIKGKDLSKRSIMVFGAGVNGQWTLNQLKKKQCNVLGVLDDKYHGCLNGLSVCKTSDVKTICNDLSEVMLIVSFFVENEDRFEKIKDKFEELGFSRENIFYFIEVLMDDYFDKKLIYKEKEDIVAAYNLLEDDTSKEVFYQFIKSVCSSDASEFKNPVRETQYFDKTVPLKKSNGYFVDCGAYRGDTYESFKQQKTEMKYIGIEPDMNNFNLLAEEIEKCGGCEILFPCAVSDKNLMVSFSDSGDKSDSPGSSICESGNATVPSIKLDTVVGGLPIAYIKMDVEGAENSAIQGAKGIIQEQNPMLAICTYHNTEDVWQLINLIHSYNKKYKFYLRSYYLYSRETVLYAIPE